MRKSSVTVIWEGGRGNSSKPKRLKTYRQRDPYRLKSLNSPAVRDLTAMSCNARPRALIRKQDQQKEWNFAPSLPSYMPKTVDSTFIEFRLRPTVAAKKEKKLGSLHQTGDRKQ
jgi:hypothetical protein